MTSPEPTLLQSMSNPTVRRLVRMRDNRTRRRSGRIIVDGWRETRRAIDAGCELLGLYTVPDGHEEEQSDDRASVLSFATSKGKRQLVSMAVLGKIGFGQSARGVVAEFTQPQHTLGNLELPSEPLILILDKIEKPGNIGAVFRCADAAGVDAVVLSDCESDLYNPNAIRSSLGAVFTVAAAVATADRVAKFLDASGVRPVAARVESSCELWAADLSGPLAIILGNEAEGLGQRWKTLADKSIEGVRIPMSGQVDSLNISVSAALATFEAVRQRRSKG